MISRRTLTLAPVALLAARSGALAAETYPDRPIKLIVPFTPGGVGDIIGRLLTQQVGAELGQSVIVENRSGGDSAAGTTMAARSHPDGYTILQLASAGLVITVLHKDLPYSLERDFAPVIGVGGFPLVLAVPGTSNIHSIADLAAASQTAKGGIIYASGGVGSLGHLAAARLVNALKITGTHVPYRGNNEALRAVMSNQVQFAFPATADAIQLVKSGAVRLLGVTSEQRLPILPDVPTMKELGFADFTPTVWYGYLVPTGTPAGNIRRLYDAFAEAVDDPAVQERLNGLGFETDVRDAAQFAEFMQHEAARWGKVIQENNITVED